MRVRVLPGAGGGEEGHQVITDPLRFALPEGEVTVTFAEGRVTGFRHAPPGRAPRDYGFPYSEAFARGLHAAHGPLFLLRDAERDWFVRARTAYMLDRFLGGLDRAAPLEVLDYGCGCGSSLAAIRAHFPHARLTGADLDAFTLAIARARFEGEAGPPRLLLSEGARLPAGTGAGYDIVQLNAVVEHLLPQERPALLGALWAALRPGGAMIVTETPWRWFPVETHTTSLPLVNYLPDRLALAALRRCGRFPRETDWTGALRLGLRGATLREILAALPGGEGAAELIRSPAPDARDLLDAWWHGEVRREGRGKRLAWRALSALRAATGIVLPPWINVVLRKRG
ncbi:MAG: methyltransferase [Roseococcus sp.]